MALDLVLGQERAVAVLRAALASGRLPGAWLFAGPAGVGKRLAARQVAKALNCPKRPGVGCDECGPCRMVDAETHPDLLVPEARDGRILKHGSEAGRKAAKEGEEAGSGRPRAPGAERSRPSLAQVMASLHFKPVLGRTKVVLLDPAEGVQDEAAGMLLKTLEEPPSHALFVLVSAAESGMLPTVRSRCQRVRFSPLPAAVVEQVLVRLGNDAQLAREAARAAGGSVERGLALLDSPLLSQQSRMVDEWLALLDLSAAERVERLSAMLPERKDEERAWLRAFLAVGGTLARDLLHAACGMAEEELQLAERRREVAAAAERVGRRGALRQCELLAEAGRALARNENPKTLLYFLGNEVASLAQGEKRAAKETTW